MRIGLIIAVHIFDFVFTERALDLKKSYLAVEKKNVSEGSRGKIISRGYIFRATPEPRPVLGII